MSERTPSQKVYDALSAAQTYHPSSARLFTDWLIQAGDVVRVTSDGTPYDLPVFNMEMTWKGSPMVEVDCTGKEKRDPPSALQRRNYGASKVQEEVDGIHSHMIQQDDKIGLVVEETSQGNVVNRASIIASINGGTGHSEAYIEADSVIVAGTAIKISDVISVYSGASAVSATFVDAWQLQVKSEPTQAAAYNTVNPNSVSDVQIVSSGSGYVLQKKTWGSPNTWTDAGTFSRAASISGAWSNGTYTVSATAGTVNPLSTTLSNVSGSNNITANGIYTYKVMYEDAQGEDQETGLTKTVTVNVSGGSVGPSNISIGDYINSPNEPNIQQPTATNPQYTDASIMRDTILACINNHHWFAFSVFYQSTNTVRRYKLDFT